MATRGKKHEWENIARRIEKEARNYHTKVIENTKQKLKIEEKASISQGIDTNGFEYDVIYRFYGLLVGIVKRIMKNYRQPRQAITEVTISNVNTHHEGRLDAVLEFGNGQYDY